MKCTALKFEVESLLVAGEQAATLVGFSPSWAIATLLRPAFPVIQVAVACPRVLTIAVLTRFVIAKVCLTGRLVMTAYLQLRQSERAMHSGECRLNLLSRGCDAPTRLTKDLALATTGPEAVMLNAIPLTLIPCTLAPLLSASVMAWPVTSTFDMAKLSFLMFVTSSLMMGQGMLPLTYEVVKRSVVVEKSTWKHPTLHRPPPLYKRTATLKPTVVTPSWKCTPEVPCELIPPLLVLPRAMEPHRTLFSLNESAV